MLRNVIQFAQSYGLIPLTILAAAIIYWLFGLLGRRKERKAIATLADMAALGEVVPDTLHPKIDPNRCIGSGACVDGVSREGRHRRRQRRRRTGQPARVRRALGLRRPRVPWLR